MKKLTAALFLVLLICSPSFAKHHRRGYEPHPELCKLKSVFVKGNSEAAVDVRKQLEKRTWLQVAASPKAADAIMEISDSQSEKDFPIRTARTTVSATISKPDGTLLWSGDSHFDEGVFNSGAGSAVKILMSHLDEDAGCK